MLPFLVAVYRSRTGRKGWAKLGMDTMASGKQTADYLAKRHGWTDWAVVVCWVQ